ncbi:hypothetical protein ABN763_08925 [Spongiivirga sp. MCCC 1A20706]|uniref:hypothetical protein n=1 Tax=Spongiivirga sp. MCCC 1A20706 TaxID=3160963 RepID=UPI003977AD70
MKEIAPYTDSIQATKTLDNGGRFFNVFTKEDDGVISQAELNKVAGLLSGKQQMILHLELLLSALSANQKQAVLTKLDDSLKGIYRKYKPEKLTVAEALDKGKLSSNVIISGVPRMIDTKTEFNGFIMIPIMTGKVTTFSMVPIIDQYDVYEVRDEVSKARVIIAHAKGQQKLPEKSLAIGGVLKELKKSKIAETTNEKYLEAFYYSIIK